MDEEINQIKNQSKQLDEQIKQLKERKKELSEKIKFKKMEKKVKGKNGNHVNQLIRVSKNFDNEIVDAQNKRLEYGRDENVVSKPKITELIIRHQSWRGIKDDIINFNFEEESTRC